MKLVSKTQKVDSSLKVEIGYHASTQTLFGARDS